MIMKNIEALPQDFQNEAVLAYYQILKKKRVSLFVKRVFDLLLSFLVFLVCVPVLLLLALFIKLDSPGPVIFSQERITQYGKAFRIYKFRTMVQNAEQLGTQVTVDHDPRITRMGRLLRKCRLDELPQLFNIIKGDMSFVGTRPEVKRYVEQYSEEMYATLLLPAGVTSLASIRYKDEEALLSGAEDADAVYVNEILPEKMAYNLAYIQKFNFWYDMKLMVMTVLAVCGIEGAKEGQEQAF